MTITTNFGQISRQKYFNSHFFTILAMICLKTMLNNFHNFYLFIYFNFCLLHRNIFISISQDFLKKYFYFKSRLQEFTIYRWNLFNWIDNNNCTLDSCDNISFHILNEQQTELKLYFTWFCFDFDCGKVHLNVNEKPKHTHANVT